MIWCRNMKTKISGYPRIWSYSHWGNVFPRYCDFLPDEAILLSNTSVGKLSVFPNSSKPTILKIKEPDWETDHYNYAKMKQQRPWSLWVLNILKVLPGPSLSICPYTITRAFSQYLSIYNYQGLLSVYRIIRAFSQYLSIYNYQGLL